LAEALSGAPISDQIFISIYNERPLAVGVFGNLLTALSRDYRQMNPGRNLLVTRIETGTLHISITDALIALMPYWKEAATYVNAGVEIVKATKAVAQFGRSLRDSISRRKEDPSFDSREGPWRSTEAMVDTAAKNRCDLEVRYSGSNGETLEVRLTSTDAEKIKTGRAPPRPRPSGKKSWNGVDELANEVKLLADEIENQPKLDDSHALIRIFVRMLIRTRNENLIKMLAKELEDRGYVELAHVVHHSARIR